LASLTVENYVKAVYQLTDGERGHAASTGELATAMKVSPGTVTSMLKSLSSSGLVMYKPYAGACLTEEGHGLAVRLVRRHRLIRQFLSQALGLPVEKVDEDAEQMAHFVSDFLVERVDSQLGHPRVDE
jgi:DtxR family transcriptional regulator, Mn-dependent transcriptional regulator